VKITERVPMSRLAAMAIALVLTVGCATEADLPAR